MTRGLAPALFCTFCCLALRAQDLPPELVIRDDFEITRSCRIVPPTHAIHDKNGDGVIHVKASDITIEFDPHALICTLFGGDLASHPPDTLTGIAIRVDGQKNVTLKGPRVRDFKVGIYATRADGLTIDGADFADMYRQRLRSTPAAEDASDWLWPHENDRNEWMTKWGAMIYVEDSSGVTVSNSTGRGGQNGILLDRVDGARIYDNDFSFLSGWGLGLWRSNRNRITRNAFDFCVRGYSHDVYNRGQDSAGILMFEQCSENVVAENSVTHGGDGIFGFAGKEALAESPAPSKDFDYKRRGCNDNLFAGNDLSYAPAHGLEMTFSFGNRIARNRFVGNAICGIWGGYSQDTLIDRNEFSENGGMGYGLERGGVNIEHGFRNTITGNEFGRNRCGVHLWWSDNKDFSTKPWGLANYRGCAGNVIADNRFEGDDVAIHLRGAKATSLVANAFHGVGRELDADATSTVARERPAGVRAPPPAAEWSPLGTKTPVGARPRLRGRENIVMTEWGPWDHESPLVRLVSARGATHLYTLHAFTKPAIAGTVPPLLAERGITVRIDTAASPPRLLVAAQKPGIETYLVNVADHPKDAPAVAYPVAGTIVSTKWKVRFFPTSAKPHENPSAWKADSSSPSPPLSIELDSLDLPFGGGGPGEVLSRRGFPDLRGKLPANHFGLVAETSIPLRRGKWRITTLSDDGIRVTADGKLVIDNWTWHVPTKDSAVIDLPADRAIPLRVEYFELDGHAVLELDIEEIGSPK